MYCACVLGAEAAGGLNKAHYAVEGRCYVDAVDRLSVLSNHLQQLVKAPCLRDALGDATSVCWRWPPRRKLNPRC